MKSTVKDKKGVIQEKESQWEGGTTFQILSIDISSFYLLFFMWMPVLRPYFRCSLPKNTENTDDSNSKNEVTGIYAWMLKQGNSKSWDCFWKYISSKSIQCYPIRVSRLGYFYRNTCHGEHKIIMAAHKDAMAEWKVRNILWDRPPEGSTEQS